jgi:hypothetical protein
MEEDDNSAVHAAIKRQERRTRESTYLQMSDSLRGFEALSDKNRKDTTRAPFKEALGLSNKNLKTAIDRFTANSLPASSYIR